MKEGVPFLNVIVSVLYLTITIALAFVFKKAQKPHNRFQNRNNLKSTIPENTNFDKIIAVSWLKKYTLVGACLFRDKKYLLKEFLFIAAYAVSCLGINRIVLWPLALSIAVMVSVFILFDVVLKKIEAKIGKQVSEGKPNSVNNQPESELDIQVVNVGEPRVNIVAPFSSSISKETAKIQTKIPRPPIQAIIQSVICFSAIVMILQTVMTLSNSISNSGQLNISSVLIIICLDQLAIRITFGVLVWVGSKIYLYSTGVKEEESSIICLLCAEEINDILVEQERERMKKQQEMTASPPKKKVQSPSKIPKALGFSGERQTYLNLINLQPTVREGQDQVIENIYLTTAEKDLFEGKGTLQEKNGFYTKRIRNKQTNEVLCYSAQKGTTIDIKQKKEFDDMIILKDDPFNQIENQIEEFYLQESNVRQTRRRGAYRKRAKRNLKLTGSSPYLQYLPDMLKKVDKYKQMTANKQNATKAIR